VVELPPLRRESPQPFRRDALRGGEPVASQPPASGRFGLVLYPKVSMLDGRNAHNPWLHELPDPVSKIVWDNYAVLSPSAAAELGLVQGDLVRLQTKGASSVVLPVQVQPGQHDRVIAVALGYGRLGTDRFALVGPTWLESKPTVEAGSLVGRNAAPLSALSGNHRLYDSGTVQLSQVDGRVELACTQDHHSLSVPAHLAPHGGSERHAVLATTLEEWRDHPDTALAQHGQHAAELWSRDHPMTGNRWAMAVDLSACTGCSACVIGCQAENNVPVVGKDEVYRHREMSWIRIDRYYAGEGDLLETVHQPMMCQHCENAPCETVCPVLATVHSSEGLNQQVYNRCVGTRYCANNCPYKVRRFNWFDYPHEDRLQNMALNPDVTIRSRGVMEKCSLCVQRIQAGKAAAKRDGRVLADGDVQTACQQSCPTRAIVFGDANDPKSAVSKLLASRRAYPVLPELNVKPAVRYLGLVRNKPANKAMEKHG